MEMVNPHNAATPPETHPRLSMDHLRETAMDIRRGQDGLRKIHRIAPVDSGWLVLAEYKDAETTIFLICEYHHDLSLHRHLRGSATLATGLENWTAQTTSKIPPTDTPTPSATRATIDRAERQCGIQREKYLAAARAWATSSEQTELVQIEMEMATEITALISKKLQIGI